MAGIDKTYTDNYKEYKAFKDWAETQVITFFDGHKECVCDWVWDYTEEDFDNGEIPIMNTPNWLDAYLIQNCRIDFVLDRIKSVHNEKFVDDSKKADFTKIPDGYEKNRKIKVKKNINTKFPIHNKPYGSKMKWWLQCEDDLWYNSETGVWVDGDSLYPNNTNTSHVKSIRSLIRHLRKQYLPKGVQFRIMGRYVGEEYNVTVH